MQSPIALVRGVSYPVRSAVGTVRAADPRGLWLAAGLQVLGAASALVLVLASHLALTAIVSGSGTAGLVLPLSLLVVATAVTGSLGALQALQQRLLGERVGQFVWERLLASCAGVDLLTYESTAFLNRLERVRGSAVGKPLSVVTNLMTVAGSSIGIAAMFGALVLLAPPLIPVLVLGGLPVVLLSRRTSRIEFAFSRSSTVLLQRRNYLKALLSHRITAAELRAFNASGEFLRRHAEDDAAHLRRLQGVLAVRRRYTLVALAASATSLAAALALVLWLAQRGSLTLADAGAAAIAARLLGGQIGSFFRALGSLTEATPFLRDLDGFLAAYPPVDVGGRAHELRGELRAENVTFRYPGQVRDALVDVTIAVPRGRVVALVGENGSGKTTLAKLLAGLYPCSTGAITWDGADLPRADLRASCSILFQDFMRYQLSLENNITVSDTSRPVDRERVEAIVNQLGLAPVVAGLPSGLDTVLGVELQEGGDLSGGQWQRVALARALYRNSDVLVLDEPSAALDPRAEHELFRDVRTVLDGRAAVLISHRYSSVQLADEIYVLHEGRIVEHGTHGELVAMGGRYAELYALQAAAYLTEHPEAPATTDASQS